MFFGKGSYETKNPGRSRDLQRKITNILFHMFVYVAQLEGENTGRHPGEKQ